MAGKVELLMQERVLSELIELIGGQGGHGGDVMCLNIIFLADNVFVRAHSPR